MAFGVNQNDISLTNNTTASSPLVHELQLGEKLNECIHETRRADFSLMLAMLCDDVREHSEFNLPHAQQLEDKTLSNQALRNHFSLPEEAPLSLRNLDEISSFNQAKTIQAKDLASIRLGNALAPKPLAFRDNEKHITTEVIANTSIHCQLKIQQLMAGAQQEASNHEEVNNLDKERLNQRLPLNVQGWLTGIEQSLVKSTLVA